MIVGLAVLAAWTRAAVPPFPEELAGDYDRVHRWLGRTYGVHYWTYSPSAKYSFRWTSPLGAPSADYGALEAKIESEFAERSGAEEAVVEKYRSVALRHPQNAKAVFSWGFAGTVAASRRAVVGAGYWQHDPEHRQLGMLNWLLAISPNPHARQYSRLRLRLETQAGHYAPPLLNLARTLSSKQPNDNAMQICLANQLMGGTNRSQWDEAIAIADSLCRKEPKHLTFLSLKSTLYFLRFVTHGKAPADARATLHAAQRCLEVAPPDSELAKDQTWRITMMQGELAQKTS